MSAPPLITRIKIHNYKSLRNVEFRPGRLSVLVGPNASGKSNFADAIDFLSSVYRSGLEMAVQYKGGLDRIIFRRAKKSGAAIDFAIEGYHLAGDLSDRPSEPEQIAFFKFEHSFSIERRSQKLGTLYQVVNERYNVHFEHQNKTFGDINLNRKGDKFDATIDDKLENLNPAFFDSRAFSRFVGYAKFLKERVEGDVMVVPETDLLISSIRLPPPYRTLSELRDIRVYQPNPIMAKQESTPSTIPDLGRFGEQLPTMFSKLDNEVRSKIIDYLRLVLPTASEINVSLSDSKKLVLKLKEDGVGGPWRAEDLSDGTIQTIAILTALFNPYSSVVIIEEPENSIHPWGLRNLIDACREASKSKQVILTTHAPVVQDMLSPDEIWIVNRERGETKIRHLTDIDDKVETAWREGQQVSIFDYLDSGIIREAVPGGVE